MRYKISDDAAKDAWTRGFVAKCAEMGIDPLALYKNSANPEYNPHTPAGAGSSAPAEGKKPMSDYDRRRFGQMSANIADENTGIIGESFNMLGRNLRDYTPAGIGIKGGIGAIKGLWNAANAALDTGGGQGSVVGKKIAPAPVQGAGKTFSEMNRRVAEQGFPQGSRAAGGDGNWLANTGAAYNSMYG